jgi:hypothetical protein
MLEEDVYEWAALANFFVVFEVNTFGKKLLGKLFIN